MLLTSSSDGDPDSEIYNGLQIQERFRSIGMILPVVTAANYAGHSTLKPIHGSDSRRLHDLFNNRQRIQVLAMTAVATLLVRNKEVVAVTTFKSVPEMRQYGVLCSESTLNAPGQSDDRDGELDKQDGKMDGGGGGDSLAIDPGQHSDDDDLTAEEIKGFGSTIIGTGFATFANAYPGDDYFKPKQFADQKVRQVKGGTSHWPRIRDLSPAAIFETIT
jgi:hypothetical protein